MNPEVGCGGLLPEGCLIKFFNSTSVPSVVLRVIRFPALGTNAFVAAFSRLEVE